MAKNNFIREAKVVDTQFQKIVCASALSNILDRVSLRFAHVQRYNDYNFIRSTVGEFLNFRKKFFFVLLILLVVIFRIAFE